jgi:SHS2 domain-containing protein
MYKYIEHEADIGIEAIGKTIEEMFEEGAKALFNVMVEIKKIKPFRKINIKCKAPQIDLLFIEWLNMLLAEKDIKETIFSEFKIKKITKQKEDYILEAIASGEKINLKKHNLKIEVKAATYSGLKYSKIKNKHKIVCVLDV